MSLILSKPVKTLGFFLGITILSLSLSYLVLAWTEPTVAPPAGNVSSPLNVGSTSQTKSGALSVTTLYDANNSSYFIDPSASTSAILAGNVGIGTASPNTVGPAKLDVMGHVFVTRPEDSYSGVYLSRSGGPTSSWNSPGGTWAVYRYGSAQGDRFNIGIAGVNEPFTILTNGNVGIGTTSPVSELDVRGYISGDVLNSYTSGDPLELQYATAGDVIVHGADSNLQVQGTGNSYFSGNVGIGTTGPTAKLHIGGTAGVDGIKFPDGTLQTSAASGTPSGFCIFSDTQPSCPSGWTRRTQFDGRTVRGDATPGGTGGSETHQHSISPKSSCGPFVGTTPCSGGSTDGQASSQSNWPPYTNVLICCKN